MIYILRKGVAPLEIVFERQLPGRISSEAKSPKYKCGDENVCCREASSEDELDKLTRTFEEQASKDLQSVAEKRSMQQSTRNKPKGMKEVREEGLQAPVPEESR